ncbi:hypothetical protein FGO68_gene8638 [Halteria grandinella]|uniref:Phosphorylated adapter RNA export protein n=1 Tax=Halteria grandinella TaxID=5974 RepID=A0A8J8P2H4_HALGN|nr:hypothetical protein FGO68_gene8638 [Halteria grandinella]
MLPSDNQLKAIQKRLHSLSGSQLEIEIVTMLREPKRHIIHSVVKVIPKEVIIDCMMQTIDVQSQGGMKQVSHDMEADEKKKSAGGVFLTLLKKNPGVTKDMMKKLLKAEKDRARDKRRTLSMLDGLDIDKIKIPKLIQPQEIQEIQTQGASVDQSKGNLNAEMLDSLPDI